MEISPFTLPISTDNISPHLRLVSQRIEKDVDNSDFPKSMKKFLEAHTFVVLICRGSTLLWSEEELVQVINVAQQMPQFGFLFKVTL